MQNSPQENKYELINRHYYGRAIRSIFLIAGLLMIVTFPFFSGLVPVPVYVSISIMVLLVVFGGLLNPAQRWLLVINVIIPIAGFVVFEYQAAYATMHLLGTDTRVPAFFWMNQILALLFFVAIYLSVKTARGRFVKEVQ